MTAEEFVKSMDPKIYCMHYHDEGIESFRVERGPGGGYNWFVTYKDINDPEYESCPSYKTEEKAWIAAVNSPLFLEVFVNKVITQKLAEFHKVLHEINQPKIVVQPELYCSQFNVGGIGLREW